MKLKELGEWRLIEEIDRLVGPLPDSVLIGIGDDAAAWGSLGLVQIATTDTLAQGVHFRLKDMSWQDLGWKALAISLSDIAAMGGIPDYALVALCLPGDKKVEDVMELYRGLLEMARIHRVGVVGGNITAFSSVIITVTVIGHLQGKVALTRDAAKPGDQIAVTGYLGTSAAGLRLLTSALAVDAETAALCKRAFRRPQPRVDEGQTLLDGGVMAAIDISDGLMSDLGHVCRRCQGGARIKLSRIPVHPRLKEAIGHQAEALALAGGEDYELLFTAPSAIIQGLENKVPFSIIGEVMSGPQGQVEVVDDAGKPVPWAKPGWEHFRS
ncbi:MAG: thiamine-phosphate kinase [Chloroflexota bacterium]